MTVAIILMHQASGKSVTCDFLGSISIFTSTTVVPMLPVCECSWPWPRSTSAPALCSDSCRRFRMKCDVVMVEAHHIGLSRKVEDQRLVYAR